MQRRARNGLIIGLNLRLKNLELSVDILSSMLKDSIMDKTEIEREKGVIIEELKDVSGQSNPLYLGFVRTGTVWRPAGRLGYWRR